MIDSHRIYIIAAVDEKNGIGREGKLPWKLKKEMRYFIQTTSRTNNPGKQNMVIMGRATWESLPEKFRPLPGRCNVVLSRERDYETPGAVVRHSLDEALAAADEKIENIFIIGGRQVYAGAFIHPAIDGIYLTHIKRDYRCDTFFPPINSAFGPPENLGSDEEEGVRFEYLFYPHSPAS